MKCYHNNPKIDYSVRRMDSNHQLLDNLKANVYNYKSKYLKQKKITDYMLKN